MIHSIKTLSTVEENTANKQFVTDITLDQINDVHNCMLC